MRERTFSIITYNIQQDLTANITSKFVPFEVHIKYIILVLQKIYKYYKFTEVFTVVKSE